MIYVEQTFEMAHRCPGSGYGEDSIHGHTWKLKVAAQRQVDDGIGEPLFLAETVHENVVKVFDHGLMVWQDDDLKDFFDQLERNDLNIFKVDFNPTAENIATYLFSELKPLFYENGFDLQSVYLQEGAGIAIEATSGVFAE